MPLITAVRRKGNGFGLYSHGELLAMIGQEAIEWFEGEYGVSLEAGAELSQDELNELRYVSSLKEARTKALYAVARRELCRAELISKLTDAGYSSEVCAGAADELESLGFLDDARYANMQADYLYRIKQYGYRRVLYELTRKGVSRDIAEQAALEQKTDPAEAISGLLTGRLSRDTNTPEGIRRCANTLARYGYETPDIYRALRELCRDNAEN